MGSDMCLFSFCAHSFNICSTELHLAHGGLVRFVGIELLLHELGKLQVALKVPAIHQFICQYWY